MGGEGVCEGRRECVRAESVWGERECVRGGGSV